MLKRPACKGGHYTMIRHEMKSMNISNIPLRATRCRIIMVLLIDMLMLYRVASRKSSGIKSWQSVTNLSARRAGHRMAHRGLSTAGLGCQNTLQRVKQRLDPAKVS